MLENDRQDWLIFVSTRLSEKRSFPSIWCLSRRQPSTVNGELNKMEINERRIGKSAGKVSWRLEDWKI